MDQAQKRKNAMIVILVFVILIISLGLLIGLYERNYAQWVPPLTTYGRNGTKQATLLFDNFAVPKNTSGAYCKKFNMENVLRTKLHGTQIQAVVDHPTIVDHISLWACSRFDLIPTDLFECSASSSLPSECGYLLYTWSFISEPLVYPSQAGLAFDAANLYGKYFLLQIRYSNLGSQAVVDNSGVLVNLTTQLRQFDGGIFPVGAPDSSISIPPNVSNTEVVGFCDSNATKAIIPDHIHLFGVNLHAHPLGRQLWLEQYPGGSTTPTVIAQDNNYQFNQQHFIPVDVELKPGDGLKLHCVYDSRSRTTTTIGGSPLSTETCFAYLPYYPALPAPNFCVNNMFRQYS